MDEPERIDYYAQLSLKRQRFVDGLIATGNKTQAAIAAGFGGENVQSYASEMSREPLVANAIAQREAEFGISAACRMEAIIAEIKEIAFFPMERILRAESKVFRVSEKLRALEVLGKWVGLEKGSQGQSQAIIINFQAAAQVEPGPTIGPLTIDLPREPKSLE